MHFLVAVSGFSGTGKDEFCKPLVEKFNAVQIDLADPAKRHMADLYGFTEEQLFGPSESRNMGDLRYPKPIIDEINLSPLKTPPSNALNILDISKLYWSFKINANDFHKYYNFIFHGSFDMTKALHVNHDDLIEFFIEEGDPMFWVSPREALQIYMMKMQESYEGIWIRKAIESHLKYASDEKWLYNYTKMGGLLIIRKRYEIDCMDKFTCIAGIRHSHEIKALREIKQCIPFLVRVKSKRVPKPPYNHKSETEQETISDSEFNYIIKNDGTVEDLHRKARIVASNLVDSKWRDGNLIPNYKTNVL